MVETDMNQHQLGTDLLSDKRLLASQSLPRRRLSGLVSDQKIDRRVFASFLTLQHLIVVQLTII